jgi:hypothetical protein
MPSSERVKESCGLCHLFVKCRCKGVLLDLAMCAMSSDSVLCDSRLLS